MLDHGVPVMEGLERGPDYIGEPQLLAVLEPGSRGRCLGWGPVA